MANKKRRKRKAKPKQSPKEKTKKDESSSSLAAAEGDTIAQQPLPPPPPTKSKSPLPLPSKTTPTTEALASMNAKNLYQLSLVCFSIALILFVSTYHIIGNNGGTASLFGATTTASSPSSSMIPLECPIVEASSSVISEEIRSSVQQLQQQEKQHTELLIGYKILHDTLRKESQLKYLHWLRGATFRSPEGSLKTLLTNIYQTSKTRTGELEQLFVDHSPYILLRDAPQSAMGDSIQNDVEKSSTGELVPSLFSSSSSSSPPPHLQWGVRFVLIQAQATRMVVALSTSLIKFEANKERKQWLIELADEFEGIRETLVESVLQNLAEGSWRN